MKHGKWVGFLPLLLNPVLAEDFSFDIHGAAWSGAGQIRNSEYSKNSATDYNLNWLQQSGTVLGGHSKIDDHWEANFSIGTAFVHLPRGSRGAANLWYPFWVVFVPDVSIGYDQKDAFISGLEINLHLGKFQDVYNPDTKNLGLYLLHGYVYPNILVSGFGNLSQAPKSITGAKFGQSFGNFKNDFLFFTETDYAPLYDFSVADIFSLNPFPGLEIGGGVNFSRVIQQTGSSCNPKELGQNARNLKNESCEIFVPDSTGNIFKLDALGNPTDTIREKVVVPRSGIKLMGRLSLDPKAWFGVGPFGKKDFSIYSELALLGLQNFPVYYTDRSQRIPVMVGINLPTFGLFNLSYEIEYFASKNSSSSFGAESGATVPTLQPEINMQRNDWKYSVNASIVFANSIEFSAVAANDHMRLGGTHNVGNGVETFNTRSGWYWATKIAYFF